MGRCITPDTKKIARCGFVSKTYPKPYLLADFNLNCYNAYAAAHPHFRASWCITGASCTVKVFVHHNASPVHHTVHHRVHLCTPPRESSGTNSFFTLGLKGSGCRAVWFRSPSPLAPSGIDRRTTLSHHQLIPHPESLVVRKIRISINTSSFSSTPSPTL